MIDEAIHILLIEDNPGDADLIGDMLSQRQTVKLLLADRLSSGLDCLRKQAVSLILLDLSLPDSLGMATFNRLHREASHIPIVVLTGSEDESLGLAAVKAGAQDYLCKCHVNAELLSRTVRYAIERKRLEKTLGESEERLRLVVESVREVIFHIDTNGILTFLNSAWTKLLDLPVSECLGKPILDYIVPSDRNQYLNACNLLWNSGTESYRFELRMLKQSGEPFWLEADMTLSRDGHQQVIGAAGTLNDISQRKINEERLLFMASHDELTGLPNRSLFVDRLNHAITQATRFQRMVAVIFLDLDQFKVINDSMGHDQGDIVLCVISTRLTEMVRASDTVARLGGDEFVIVLPDLESEVDAIQIANKIMKSFEQPVWLKNQEIFIGGSVGIAMFPKDGDSISQLVRNADTAMYRSKDLGRKRICFYSPEMNSKLLERLTLENDLRRALDKDELEVYYQPKIAMATRQVLGFEALLRWRHPTRGVIGPDQIIPLAESSGLILAIGSWVLTAACRQWVAWKKMGHEKCTMAVNLSPRQFWQENLEEDIARILKETGMCSRHLELEITESSVMRNAEETIATLRRLNAMGIILSIDDFGTGYSSLSYLKRFPIHALKVDQSFVRDITFDPDAAAIAQGIIALAHSMKLQVIAEGVETDAQFELLRQWECDAMQGYYFSKPRPGNAVLSLLY